MQSFTFKEIKEIPYNRTNIKIGDICAGIWFNEPDYHIFKVEDVSNGKLGFATDNVVYEINDAFHIVKLF